MALLMTSRAVLVACLPPFGTIALRQLARSLRQPQHVRWNVLRQSRPRIAGGSLARPASITSSQPPLQRCCDDRLNPPSIPEATVVSTKRPGILGAPVKP